MGQFVAITVIEAQQRLESGTAVLVDIRDPQSFHTGHVPGAFHLTDSSINQLMQEVDKVTPVMVMCYHGHSSRGVAQYLLHLGYEEVYSVDGGFYAWSDCFPNQVDVS